MKRCEVRWRGVHCGCVVGVLAGVTLLGGCTAKRDHHIKVIPQHAIGAQEQSGTRQIVPSTWDTAYQFGADGPQYSQDVAITPSGFLFINSRADSVISVTWKATSRWRVALRIATDSQPPFPVQIAATRDDQAWILNGKSRAIKSIGENGANVRLSLTKNINAEGITALGLDTVLVLVDADSSPVLAVTRRGVVIRKSGLPWGFYGRLHPLARASELTSDETGRWAIAFAYGDGWAVSETSGVVHAGLFVEATKFPDLLQFGSSNGVTTEVPRTTRSAISIALEGAKLYVLFGGATAQHDRLIDVYDVPTATYSFSYLLPERAGRIFVMNGAVFAIGQRRPLRILKLRHKLAAVTK